MNSENNFLSDFPVPGNDIIAVTLGGLGRIGMNWTLYGHKGEWVLVDAGVGFPEIELDNIDSFIPDPLVLESIKDKIVGLVITHAHEDHIGAIDRLWPHVFDCPIYATPFCSEILTRRFIDRGVENDVTINQFKVDSKFNVGKLVFDSVRLTHSVPEPVGFLISDQEKNIKIFHTGDWKIDEFPLVGDGMNYSKLESFGKEGVTAMLCDSTNANKEMEMTSEADVREALIEIVQESKGMVVIASFGTNIARIQSAIIAAGEANRKIALGGFSLRNNYQTAVRQGLVTPTRHLLESSYHLKGLDKSEIVVACSGVQSEPKSILFRMTHGLEKRFPGLTSGDTVVISASKIPQRIPYIEEMIITLKNQGIRVFCAGDVINNYPVHVTGHASSQEISEMQEMINPEFIIPLHGEISHMDAHEQIAINNNIPTVRSSEGGVLLISPHNVKLIGKIHVPLSPLSSDDLGNRLIYENPFVDLEEEKNKENTFSL